MNAEKNKQPSFGDFMPDWADMTAQAREAAQRRAEWEDERGDDS